MSKKATIAGVLIALASPLFAQDLPESIKASGEVVVLNQPEYAPMEYRDPATGELRGLDVDLQLALAKELGLKVKWSESTFEQLIPSLLTGRANLIHSGMSDTEKRRENLDFLDYMKSGAQFYTTDARKGEFQALTDFCGKRVGMPKTTSFPADVASWSEQNCIAAGKPGITVMGTEGSADTFMQLKQGRIDAGVQGSETLPYLMSQDPKTFSKVGPPFTVKKQGMGFLKKDNDLRDAYATALRKLMISGEYKAIFAKWKQEDNQLDGIYVNDIAVE
ncbi:ABC transporter substrate-binding protein [Rhizobium sp. R693]|uniref:ABC transporter substrate-binding protein n=1 Tax=Rhizobium sp. R693 TaxID=1764276 RepID=UPI000B531B9E|nr:ABC transporter substrate-binding protein [Rhizobium sp. R693]OWV98753.1 ABC transporter substrate-binding protein [Rhizobium sp. R693]